MNSFNEGRKSTIAAIGDDESFRLAVLRLLSARDCDPMKYSSAEEFLTDTSRTPVQCLVLNVSDLSDTGPKGSHWARSR